MSAGAETLFPLAFRIETPFGACVGVDLAAAGSADPAALRAALHPDERPLTEGMRGARLVEFAGARVAARIAGVAGPVLRGPGGMPVVDGTSVSLSHTRRTAAALLSLEAGVHVGIDIETLDDGPGLDLLAGRIMADDERDCDGLSVVERLSWKEAAWKACYPITGPVPLRRLPVGTTRIEGAGGVAVLAVAAYRIGGDVVAAAAARRVASSQPAASPIGSQNVTHVQSIGVRIRS